jgi:hypothetical protein
MRQPELGCQKIYDKVFIFVPSERSFCPRMVSGPAKDRTVFQEKNSTKFSL